MPTPASGTISMNDMRNEINRATASAISMSEMRDRYGGSGALSFSDLYKCEGFTVNPANITQSSKYININYDGFDLRIFGPFGSVSPNEASGIQIAANSYIGGSYSTGGTSTDARLNLFSNTTLESANGTFTSGYNALNVTRIVTANVARSIVSTVDQSVVNYTYDWPTTGTIHCLVKF